MKIRFLVAALILLHVQVLAQDTVKRGQQEMHRLHQNSKAYIAMLEDPKRDAYQNPHEVMMALDLKEGEDLVQQMETNGFKLLKEHTFLDYQYFLVFSVK